MFFSNEILTKKGGQFAVVWLVGNFNTVHGSKRLGLKKSDYVSVDVVKACGDMLNPRTQFALRLSATLLMGIIRIYEKQITIVYDEVKSMWIFLKRGSFMRPENVDLPSQRYESFALPNPLYNYDKEMGNEQSDIRFYTSLGEKALLEGQGQQQKGGHESRADSAYFTISFGDQDITNTEYEASLVAIAEESPAKRRKISKDSFLDIIEDPHTPLKMKEKVKHTTIEVPGELEFETLKENHLLNISEEQLNEKFAECSQANIYDSGLLGDMTGMTDPTLPSLANVSELPDATMLEAIPECSTMFGAIPEDSNVLGNDRSEILTDFSNIENPLLGLNGDISEAVPEELGLASNLLEDMILTELSSRIQTDPVLLAMTEGPDKENIPPVSHDIPPVEETDKENMPLPQNEQDVTQPAQDDAADKENLLEQAQKDKDTEQLLLDENDKENQDPNVRDSNAPRRSARAKQPTVQLRPAKDKVFDTSIGSFELPAAPAPKDVPAKRKRKRHLIVDTKNQLSVKEMKKFMKSSRQHLCVDPTLVHQIRPDPEELFAGPHRPYVKRVPELMGLWKRCAFSGSHDLTEMLALQEQIDTEQAKEAQEEEQQEEPVSMVEGAGRKRPRSSVLSDIEIGRFGANSTIRDPSESEGDLTRLDSTTDTAGRLSDNFGPGGNFRTSTVVKPNRGSGLAGPQLSPIQQLADFDESLIPNQQDLFPIIEEQSMLQDPTIGELPDISEVPQLSELGSVMEQTSTMFGQDIAVDQERAMSPIPDLSLADQTLLQPSSPERPRTPLVERLSGVPMNQEDTVAEDMAAFRYFPHRESQKFYRFVERKFTPEKEDIVFEDLVPTTHSRKTAALAFYQLLLLKKFSHVTVRQEDDPYFADISIKLSH